MPSPRLAPVLLALLTAAPVAAQGASEDLASVLEATARSLRGTPEVRAWPGAAARSRLLHETVGLVLQGFAADPATLRPALGPPPPGLDRTPREAARELMLRALRAGPAAYRELQQAAASAREALALAPCPDQVDELGELLQGE